MHETAEEADGRDPSDARRLRRILRSSPSPCPSLKGQKTPKEQFAGAEATYTIEAMMPRRRRPPVRHLPLLRRRLRPGLRHPVHRPGQQASPTRIQTSWGVSTRLIGGIIMTHGDDNGLALPPAIAPIQLVIIPIAQHKEGRPRTRRGEVFAARSKPVARVKLDESDNSPGWKFSQYEMKGVPLRLETRPEGHRAEPVRPRPPRHPREDRRLPRRAGDRRPAGAPGRPRRPLREAPSKTARTAPGTPTTGRRFRRDRRREDRLHPGDVVRRRGLRGQDQGRDRPQVPAASPSAKSRWAKPASCCGRPAKKLVYWGRQY